MTEQQIIDWIWDRAVTETNLAIRPPSFRQSYINTYAGRILARVMIDCELANFTPEALLALRLSLDGSFHSGERLAGPYPPRWQRIREQILFGEPPDNILSRVNTRIPP